MDIVVYIALGGLIGFVIYGYNEIKNTFSLK